MSVGFGGQRVAWQGLWDEVFAEDLGWLRTNSGVKNGIFKLVPTVIDWYKECTGDPLSSETRSFRNALKDCKNFMALAELPEKINKFRSSVSKFWERPSDDEGVWGHLDLAWRVATSASGVVAPTLDLAEAIDARIFRVAAETLQPLKNLNALGTIIGSVDGAVKNITRIWRAVHVLHAPRAAVEVYDLGWRVRQVNIDEQIDPQMVIELSLIDLAKCISYIALGAILFISACITTIPSVGTWILLSSSSGLAFTIIEEFYHRLCRGPRRPGQNSGYQHGNPRYPYLPDVAAESGDERRHRLRILA